MTFKDRSRNLRFDADTEKWVKEFERLCRFLSKNTDLDIPKIKVAVLDSGIDPTHPFIEQFWRRAPSEENAYHDFVSFKCDATPEDQDGHGKFVASIILRFAPHVELYVARVAERNKTDIRHLSSRITKVCRISDACIHRQIDCSLGH